MAYRDLYQSQVALLMRMLPLVAEEEEFALKGGTAINLFYRDMPRLSVDIDLTFVPIMGWDDSLAAIDAALCSGQLITDTTIGFFAAMFRSKTAGDRLPNTEFKRSQL